MKEKVYFENSKGNKLCGILSNPSGDNTKPIIIMCHGFTTNKDNKTNTRLKILFSEKNISTFRFDFYGHGESEGKFKDITVSEVVDNILRAINFLKERGYSKIGLMGSSFGGLASIIAASKSNDLFVLALSAPVSNWEKIKIKQYGKDGIKKWKEEGYITHVNNSGKAFKLSYSFFDDLKYNNAHDIAGKIIIPTIIVQGDQDKNIRLEQNIKTSKLIKNCRFEIIKGCDHYFSKPDDFEKKIKLISNFIIKESQLAAENT